MSKEPKVTWVVQSNLGSDSAFDRLYEVCDKAYQYWISTKAIPFDTEPLHFESLDTAGPFVIYGATGFVARAFKQFSLKRGVFFDEETFRYDAYARGYERKFINSDARYFTVGELAETKEIRGFDEHVFVRPVPDGKQFAGEVIPLAQFSKWCHDISAGGFTFDKDLLIAVARPKELGSEWRLFIVDGYVVGSSEYRYCGRLVREVQQKRAPKEVVKFAEEMHKRWNPGVPVYVMDVALDRDGYGVLELNCFNSCGFYGADLKRIFEHVSEVSRGLVKGGSRLPEEKTDAKTG